MQNSTPSHFNAFEHVRWNTQRAGTVMHRSHCEQAPCKQRAGTVLAASSHRAAPYMHRAATYRAQPVRRCAAFSDACTALQGFCPLRVRRLANRVTPCIKIKIVYFFKTPHRHFRCLCGAVRSEYGACAALVRWTLCMHRAPNAVSVNPPLVGGSLAIFFFSAQFGEGPERWC